MTLDEWETIKTDYLENSQEFVFYFDDNDDNLVINLCWSLDDELPYEVNVCLRKCRFFKKTLLREKYATQMDLLNNFKYKGKTLDELYDKLD
jgi:hypothetical protein